MGMLAGRLGGGMTGLLGNLAPVLVAETANGRRVLELGFGNKFEYKQDTNRLTARLTGFLPKEAGEAQRLLVGVIDRGKKTAQLTFSFKDVALPAAEDRKP